MISIWLEEFSNMGEDRAARKKGDLKRRIQLQVYQLYFGELSLVTI